MGVGRRGGHRRPKSLRGVVTGVVSETDQFAVSQLLQAGQTKGAGQLQLHVVRERRGTIYTRKRRRYRQYG